MFEKIILAEMGWPEANKMEKVALLTSTPTVRPMTIPFVC
jgi:hypothetical protein